MTDYYQPDDEPPEDISYEDFDDVIYTDADEFTPIDLDALDDALPAEAGPSSPETALDQATSDLLDMLDDVLPRIPRPPVAPTRRVTPPLPSLAEDTDRFLASLDDALPAEAGPTAPETALDQATRDLLDTLDDALPPAHRPAAAPPPRPVVPRPTAPPARELADDTERLLDMLDDALPAEPGLRAPETALSQATSDLLDTLDDALPAVRQPPRQQAVVPPPRLVSQAAPRVVDPSGLEQKPSAALAYQLLIGLPPELGALVLELRATGDIEDMPPPGLCLTPRFHTPDPDALDAALERWTQEHLPLALEITGVQAEVVGAQQYTAAWHVQPQNQLRQAVMTLKKALGGLVQPLPGEPTAIRLRITIGDHIAARRYPYVIAQMQRDFEPTPWQAQTLVLASWSAPAEWDIVATYPGALPRPTP